MEEKNLRDAFNSIRDLPGEIAYLLPYAKIVSFNSIRDLLIKPSQNLKRQAIFQFYKRSSL